MNNKTRFMTVMFSASEKGDEELLNQVAGDIQAAKENGSFEDENGEMSYKDLGDEGVLAVDNENGEQTLIHNEMIQNGDDVFIEMEKIPDYCVEDQSHPEVVEEEGSMVVNPMAEKEFSVTSNNTAVLRIFSDQDLVETVADTVGRTEQDAVVGDLKFEKQIVFCVVGDIDRLFIINPFRVFRLHQHPVPALFYIRGRILIYFHAYAAFRRKQGIDRYKFARILRLLIFRRGHAVRFRNSGRGDGKLFFRFRKG